MSWNLIINVVLLRNEIFQVGVVVHTYNPSYSGVRGRKTMIQGQQRQKYEILSEK
jgi:hypothetical protein